MAIFIILGLILGGGIIGYGYLGMRQEEESLETRLGRYDLRPARSLTQLELQLPRHERFLKPFQLRVARLVRHLTPGGTIEKTQLKLAQAGHPNNLTVQDFLGVKGLLSVALAIAVFLFFTFVMHPAATLFLFGLGGALFAGFFLPDMWLRRKIGERQKEIQRYLPDAIDILAISVAAGQGFDGALETLSRRKHNALTLEFDRFRMETQAGKGRREALRDMALRVAVEDLGIFVAAMIQADQLGIGIAHVLRTQSDELRVKRRQRAEEKARQAPVKMLFPLVFLMFPSLFIVILGPALPQLAFLGHA